MAQLKLKVGTSYRNRLGEVVTITDKYILTSHPFQGSDGEYYRANGQSGFFKKSDLDLIEETQDTSNLRKAEWYGLIADIVEGKFNKAA